MAVLGRPAAAGSRSRRAAPRGRPRPARCRHRCLPPAAARPAAGGAHGAGLPHDPMRRATPSSRGPIAVSPSTAGSPRPVAGRVGPGPRVRRVARRGRGLGAPTGPRCSCTGTSTCGTCWWTRPGCRAGSSTGETPASPNRCSTWRSGTRRPVGLGARGVLHLRTARRRTRSAAARPGAGGLPRRRPRRVRRDRVTTTAADRVTGVHRPRPPRLIPPLGDNLSRIGGSWSR